MADLIALFIVLSCCCCGGIALLPLVILMLVVALWPEMAGKPSEVNPKPAKPPKAPKAPKSPPMLSGAPKFIPSRKRIHFPGGKHEWDQLLAQIDLRPGETAESLAEKGEVMVNFIKTLERSILIPLWALAEGSRYYSRGVAEDHPLHRLAAECSAASEAWQSDFPEMRGSCLTGGRENSQALTCLIDSTVAWLDRVTALQAGFQRGLSHVEESSPVNSIRRLQERLDDLIYIRSRLAERDISWMNNIPRTTFSSVENLRQAFSAHFGPFDRDRAILPEEDIIERRPGKLWLDKHRFVEYAFGIDNDTEYLQFRFAVLNSSRPGGLVTNYRLYPSGLQEKYAPWVCEHCGEKLDGPYQQCGECSADQLAYLAWGKKD